ncbi:Gcd10p family-domain-containing protein [Morchella snyderi]|nr:Gcd10p family-domain-containing protein [Morchella snyderi]
MASPHDLILPHTHILLRLPSGAPRILVITPDTTISLGKFGSFPANALLYRPYNLTFDILDAPQSGLRVVSAAEITRDVLGGEEAEAEAGEHYKEEAEEAMRNNRQTVDDPAAQKMSWEEIEEAKKVGSGSGRDLVQKLLSSHTALHQKTPFSLQKYTLRKTKKFLRRFTVLPLTVSALNNYLLEVKEPQKILDLRDETLGLMLSLGNVHYGGRWLVVDETGGLLVAAVAERLGLLTPAPAPPPPRHPPAPEPLKTSNTITLIHPNEQPNLSLLKYFSYDTNNPTPAHPLHTHLHTLNWLQVVSPQTDMTLQRPAEPAGLAELKGGKRGAYYRKLRRWQHAKAIADDTAAGGFDGLLVAGYMELAGVLRWAVPLLRGSAQVVVYGSSREPVAEAADLYSSVRKADWIAAGGGEGLDPTLLLAPTVMEVRARRYQVLPGRTHPVMTSRGGGEGCVLVGTRVVPVVGRVEARGVWRGGKKRRGEGEGEVEGEGAEAGSPQKRMKGERGG